MNHLGMTEHGIDLILLQVANHIQTDLGQIIDSMQALEFTHELLRAVLPQQGITRAHGIGCGININRLGHRHDLDVLAGAASVAKRNINPLKNLLAATTQIIKIYLSHAHHPVHLRVYDFLPY